MQNELLDERPVGGSSFQISEFPEDYDPLQNKDNELTLEQKLYSKIWKFRQEALQNIIKKQIFQEYKNQIINMLSDNHIQVQETAFECLKLYVQDCQQISFDIEECIKKIIEKLSIKQKNLLQEILIPLVEKSRKKEEFLKAIKTGLQLKIPKQIQNALSVLLILIQNYGTSYWSTLDSIWGELEAKISMANPLIVQDTVKIYKECFFFMGSSIRVKLNSLKSNIQQEFDEFLKTDPQSKEPLRQEFLDTVGEKKQETSDIYDVSIPLDVLAHFPETWLEKTLQIEKWNLKKENLDQFIAEMKLAHKIVPRSFIPYISFLKRVIQDANINVSMSGIKILQELANRVRKPMAQASKVLLPYIIQKLKDKKTILLDTTHQCLEVMFNYSLNSEDFSAEFQEYLMDKNPQLKIQILKFLGNMIKIQKKVTTLKLLCNFDYSAQTLQKLMEDGVGEVRSSMNQLIMVIYDQFGMEGVLETFYDIQESLKNKIQKLIGQPLEIQKKPIQQNNPNPVTKNKDNYINIEFPELNLSEDLQQMFQNYDGCINWEKKVQIIQKINLDLINQQNIYPVLLCLQQRFKNWKESNLNLNKELISIIKQTAHIIPGQALSCIMSLLIQKLQESQFTRNTLEILVILANNLPLKTLVSQSLSLLKSPKQIQEFGDFLNSLLPEQQTNFPFKMIQDFIKISPKPIMQNLVKKMQQTQNSINICQQEKLVIQKCLKLLTFENSMQKGIDEIKKALLTEKMSESELEELSQTIKKQSKVMKNKLLLKNLFSIVTCIFQNQQGHQLIPFILSQLQEKQILIKSEIVNAIGISSVEFPVYLLQGVLNRLQNNSNIEDRQELWSFVKNIDIQSTEKEIQQQLVKEAKKDGVVLTPENKNTQIQSSPLPKTSQIQSSEPKIDYFVIQDSLIGPLQQNIQQKLGYAIVQGLFSYSQETFIQTLEKINAVDIKSAPSELIFYLRMRILYNLQNNQIGAKLYNFLTYFIQACFGEILQENDLTQLLVISLELLGNYNLNCDQQLKQIIQNIFMRLTQPICGQILSSCFFRYQGNLKNDLFYIIDNNYRNIIDRNTMKQIDNEYQSQMINNTVKNEAIVIENDVQFVENLQQMSSQDFQHKNSTILGLIAYNCININRNIMFDHIIHNLRISFTENIHLIQNQFLNNFTSFVQKFLSTSQFIEVLNNLIRQAEIKSVFSEQQTKNLNQIIIGYLKNNQNSFLNFNGPNNQLQEYATSQLQYKKRDHYTFFFNYRASYKMYDKEYTAFYQVLDRIQFGGNFTVIPQVHSFILFTNEQGILIIQNDDMVMMVIKTFLQNSVDIFGDQLDSYYQLAFQNNKENQIQQYIQLYSYKRKSENTNNNNLIQNIQNNPNIANMITSNFKEAQSPKKNNNPSINTINTINSMNNMNTQMPQIQLSSLQNQFQQSPKTNSHPTLYTQNAQMPQIQLSSLQNQFHMQKTSLQVQKPHNQVDELHILIERFKKDQSIEVESIYDLIKNKSMNLLTYFNQTPLPVLSIFIKKITQIHTQNLSDATINISPLLEYEDQLKKLNFPLQQQMSSISQNVGIQQNIVLPNIQDYVNNRFNLNQEQKPATPDNNYLQKIQEARSQFRQKMGFNN